MTPASKRSIEDLAARIDEGERIDWDHERRQAADEESRSIIDGYRVLAELRDSLRSQQTPSPQMPAPATPPRDRGTPWGDLRVLEVVGRGSFGTVYRALDSFDRTVALKVLDPGLDPAALKRRILDEGKLLAQVRHPNIVTVHDVGESDNRVGLWMEFIEGRTLAAEVDARGRLGAEEAVVIGRTLCSTLAAIHGAGIVHADVKPQNVMREDGGRIVLMDFGAGDRQMDADPRRLAGTPLYLAPERLDGGPLTPACDIYSLGVLLYFLVTGAHPVEGDTRDDVERAHRAGQRVRLRDRRPDLPPGFVTAVEDALAPDPARRHATAGAFDDVLARAVGPADPQSKAGHPADTRRRRWPWSRLVIAVAAALFVGVAAIGTMRVIGREDPGAAKLSAAAVALPAPGTYSISAGFFKVDETTRAPVVSGGQVAPGDRLELDLTLSQDAYVYVINEDDAGSQSCLFPLPGGELQNPLRGGRSHVLPGRIGREAHAWKISPSGGREQFYVVVSLEPSPEMDAAVADLTPASRPEVGRNASGAGAFRGVTEVVPHPQPPRTVGAVPWHRDAKPLAAGVETVQGLTIRQLTLDHPPPRR